MLCPYQRLDLPFRDRHERPVQGINHLAFRITDREAWLRVAAREQLELHYGDHTDYAHSTSRYPKDPTGYETEIALWKDDRVVFEPMPAPLPHRPGPSESATPSRPPWTKDARAPASCAITA